MTNKLAAIDSGAENSQPLAALRGKASRAYLAGGPVFALVVIAVFAIALALASIAKRFSRAEHAPDGQDGSCRPANF